MRSAYVLIALAMTCCATAHGQTPIGGESADAAPALFSAVAPDGSIDVAWRTANGRLMLSAFSGDDWKQGHSIQLSGTLGLVGGLAIDGQGNRYVAAFRDEVANENAWSTGYRPNVAQMLRIQAGSDRVEVLADLNQPKYSGKWPIINPVHCVDGATNSHMVINGDKLLLTYGHNNGQFSDIHSTGSIIAISTDGTAVYSDGGEQHPGQEFAAVDGDGYVIAQTFDQGLGLSTMKPENGRWKWSNFVLIHELNPANDGTIQIGGIVPTSDGYQVVYASGGGWVWNNREYEPGAGGDCAIVVMHVRRDFDTLPKFDWWQGIRNAQGNFIRTTLIQARPNRSLLRPLVIPRGDDTYLVVCEQWGENDIGGDDPMGVIAQAMSADGQPQGDARFFPGIRIQKFSDGMYLPGSDRCAWVVGDRGASKLMLNTLDRDLVLRTYILGYGQAYAERGQSADLVGRPAINPPPATDAPRSNWLANVAGEYRREPVENDWHVGRIEAVQDGNGMAYQWTNQAGASWKLLPDEDNRRFNTDETNPYFNDNGDGNRIFELRFAANPNGTPESTLEGFNFNGEFYKRSE
jgi:type II secretory pathway pseudopilin PulG